MSRKLLVVVLGCLVVLGFGGAAQTATSAAPTAQYIVQLSASPVASYKGGVAGIPATSPKVTGRRSSTLGDDARRYRDVLATRQADVLRAAGSPKVLYSYRTAFNGFSAELTLAQVRKLQATPGVAQVTRNTLRHTTAALSASPTLVDGALGGAKGDGASYLGLPNGLWKKLGGPDKAGAGVIVGVIDTGITPEHPSFADTPAGGAYAGPAYTGKPPVWNGICQTVPDPKAAFGAGSCNKKLIGARFFVDGFGTENLDAASFISPRDDDGHGSHTASTAAGNFGVNPSIGGNDLGVGRVSGIAPRAYVAMYKACWVGNQTTSLSGCAEDDLVAAIDAAVSDGVDVINYSIGDDTPAALSPDAVAFLGASDAGVFVSVSAGNAGPGPSTVGAPAGSPWLTTAAASTLARTFESTATFTGGDAPLVLNGASVTAALPATPLVDAATAGLADADPADAELCLPGTLDPAKVTGKAVLCLRGNNARVDKSHNVQLAGGVGMVLYNPSPTQDVVTDNHFVPSVHLSLADGEQVKEALAAGPLSVALTAGKAAPLGRGGVLADFSSRGPQAAVPDIGKPDITAPGVNILAAASPRPAPGSELKPGELFQSISGTSMSSPHIAGAGALLTQVHPTWHPAAMKSALMTTANPDVLESDGRTPANALETGSGEIDPNKAVDPGLVLEAGTTDYLQYLEGLDPDLVTGDIPPIAPADLNLPSITFSDLVGTATTTREFTSVDSLAGTWSVAVKGLAGFDVRATPGTFQIAPGQPTDVEVAITRTSAPFDEWAYGALVLTQGKRTVRLPINVKPTALSAPAAAAVITTAATGTQKLTVKPGFAGTLSGVGWGLAAPELVADQETVLTTTQAPVLDADDDGTKLYDVDVPDGAQLFRAALSNVAAGDEETDLDLFLYYDADGDGEVTEEDLVAESNTAGSVESLSTDVLPPGGHYVIAVVGWQTAEAGAPFDLTTWLVDDPTPDDPAPAPGLTVTGDPLAVKAGDDAPLTLGWSGVTAPGTYLGVVTYHDTPDATPESVLGATVVELTRSSAATVDPGTGPTATPDPAAPASPPAATPDAPAPVTDTTAAPAAPVTPAPAADPNAVPGSADSGAAPKAVAKVPAVTVRGLRVALAGRVLSARVGLSRAALVRVDVARAGKTVTRAKSRRVAAGTRTLKVQLARTLKPGSYRVSFVALAGGKRVASKALLLKVK